MNVQPRAPIRRGPPRQRATAGDIVFAIAIAGLGLVLAGALLAAGGGTPWLTPYLPGAAAGSTPDLGAPASSDLASTGPIAPASVMPDPAATPGP